MMEPLAYPIRRDALQARDPTQPHAGLPRDAARRARAWSSLAAAVLLAGCATPPPPSPPPATYHRPIVSPWAAKHAMMKWTEADVRACFGAPRDSDMVASWPRYRFQRGGCTEHVMFKNGKVHSVEGYGFEQECRWVVDACQK